MLTVGNYHYIRQSFDSLYPSIFGLTPQAFKKQLLFLKKIGVFIHPNELLGNIEEILNSKQNYFLITFDDGLKEQYEFCKLILDDLEMPALFFVNSINYIEKEVSLVHKIHLLRSVLAPEVITNELFNFNSDKAIALTSKEKQKAITHYNYDTNESALLKYILNFKLSYAEQSKFIDVLFPQFFDESKVVSELYMSEEELIDISKNGWLGSHTHSHFSLGDLSPDLIKIELAKTKDYLENLTKTNVLCVSYPYGSEEACKQPVPEIAEEVGHQIGFTMERGINYGKENILALKRFDCNDLPLGKNEKVFKNEYSTVYK